MIATRGSYWTQLWQTVYVTLGFIAAAWIFCTLATKGHCG